MKNAMKHYFSGLNSLYRSTFGTAPTVSWDSGMDQSLFISGPDEDGEAQWQPAPGTPLKQLGGHVLGTELSELFGGWYYWQLRGKYNGILLDFTPVPNAAAAAGAFAAALADGGYYFPGEDCLLLASCEMDGNDDLLLFCRRGTGALFLYDRDRRRRLDMTCTLTELVGRMEAVL